MSKSSTKRRLRGLLFLTGLLPLALNSQLAHAAWPSLTEVWKKAKSAAPDIVRARGGVLLAQSAGVGARTSSFHNPYLEIYVDRPTSNLSGVNVTGVLFLPFDIGGQRGARITEADALLAWQKVAQTEAESRVLGATVIAYGAAVVAAVRLAQAEIAEHQAEAEVDYFTGRAAAGDATIVDQSLAEAEVARYSQIRAEAGIDLVRARLQVAVLTGVTDVDSPPADAPTDPPPLRMTDPNAQMKQVLERSPFLKSLDSEALFYGRQRDRAEADRSPPLSAIVTAGRNEFGDARVGGGIGWSFPVVRRNEGEIARAFAEEGRTRSERSSWVLVLRSRTRADTEEYRQTLEAIGSLDRAGLPAAARVADATLASFQAGKTELVRVINARRDLAVARSRRLDLVQSAWAAYGDLAALLGDLP